VNVCCMRGRARARAGGEAFSSLYMFLISLVPKSAIKKERKITDSLATMILIQDIYIYILSMKSAHSRPVNIVENRMRIIIVILSKSKIFR